MTFVLYSNHSWYLCSVFLSQPLLTFLFLLQTKPWPRPQQLHLWRPPRLLSNALKQWHPAGTPKQTKTLIQTPSLSPTEGRISSDAVTSSSVSIVTAISSIGFDVVSVNLVLPFFSRASDLYTCTRVVQLFIRLLRYSWPHDHVTSSETLPRDKVAILASLQFFVVFIWLFYLLYPFWIYFWVCAIYLYYLCLFFKNWYILIFIIEKYGLKK